VFSGAAVLWAGSLPVAALAARDASGLPHTIAALVYAIGHVLCHQRPERSFSWQGQSWPVCARCAGLYMGVALGVVLAQTLRLGRTPGAPAVRLWLAAAAFPTVITILYEWTTADMPAHAVRAVTGGVIGLVAAVLIVSFLREWHGAPPANGMTTRHEVN
jgi:uncharacterized membrane protein